MTNRALSRVDIAFGILTLILLSATGFVVLRGDQVGIRVRDYSPTDRASGRPTIKITFDEAINPVSLAGHFAIDPQIDGQLAINATEVVFRPNNALTPGTDYTITFRAGIAANTGRQLKQDVQWHIQITTPRLVYQGPVDSIVQNLFLFDPTETNAKPKQITQRPDGIGSFAITPDGSGVLYTGIEKGGGASLYLYDVASDASNLLYECKDAVCSNPVWRPDGGAIAYERSDLNTNTNLGSSVPRIWVYDLTAQAAKPLYTDAQRIGMSPRWASSGTRLAFYDPDANAIVIHDFDGSPDRTITMDQGTGQMGDFSPDGNTITYPKVILPNPQQYVSHWVLTDISKTPFVQRDLEPDAENSDDVESIWTADNKGMIVLRQTPGTATSAATPAQVYLVDIASGTATPLFDDPGYRNGNPALSPDGTTLLVQRTPVEIAGARTELWSYNLITHEQKLLVKNGALPRWLP
jgi:Tol biopolymer transport system component